jgi:hypothetical protein
MFKNRTAKRSWAILMAGLILVTVSALFLAPRVAAASCFTDTTSHWAETFICWMKNHGLTSGYPDGTFRPDNMISRGEVSVFMQKIITTGDVYITTGPTGWSPNGTSYGTGYVKTYYMYSHLRSTAAGTQYFQLSPSLPSSLYNSLMYIKGVEICYDSAGFGATLSQVDLYHIYYSGGTPTIYHQFTDATDYTDAACRTFYFPTAGSFYGTDQLTIMLTVDFPAASSILGVTSTTVILSPSTGTAVLDVTDALGRSADLPVLNDPRSGK